MRTSEIAKRPVVTRGGDDVAQVKDVVFAADGGELQGFTLAGRGLLAGPLKTALPWTKVSALGRDAVMIIDGSVLVPREQLLAAAEGAPGSGGRGGDVLGSRVLTDDGTELGTVVDVVVDVPDAPGDGPADVVGYEIEASAALGTAGRKVLIPLPDTLAVSGENLMVPSSAREFVSNDLSGFGAAVAEFRSRLESR